MNWFKVILYFTPFLLSAKIKYIQFEYLIPYSNIIDISTNEYCKNNGIYKKALNIPLFDYKKRYNINDFIKKLSNRTDFRVPYIIMGENFREKYDLAYYLSESKKIDVYILIGNTKNIIRKYNLKKYYCNK